MNSSVFQKWLTPVRIADAVSVIFIISGLAILLHGLSYSDQGIMLAFLALQASIMQGDSARDQLLLQTMASGVQGMIVGGFILVAIGFFILVFRLYRL